MKPIKKILISGDKQFYVRDTSSDMHTQFGFIKSSDLKKKDGSILESNTGKEFMIFTPSFIDSYMKIKRGAQIIARKDIAAIIAETGINKKSVVVDAGSGSGALACLLANIVKEVNTYDIREDHLKIVNDNIKFLGLTNVKAKLHDIYTGVLKKNVDLVVLDVPEPWQALEPALKSLNIGGFIVSYSPSIPQTIDFVNKVKENKGLLHVKTIEIFEREWEIEGRKVRPFSRVIGHTGFLSFIRKV